MPAAKLQLAIECRRLIAAAKTTKAQNKAAANGTVAFWCSIRRIDSSERTFRGSSSGKRTWDSETNLGGSEFCASIIGRRIVGISSSILHLIPTPSFDFRLTDRKYPDRNLRPPVRPDPNTAWARCLL